MKNSNCKNKIFNTKQNNGITLIALILTIIVLMILAVVAISAVNDGGIIQHAQDAKNEHTIAQEKEKILLAQSEWTLTKYSNNSGQTFKTFMKSKLVDTGLATNIDGNDNGPLTVKMKSGNTYTVNENGGITPVPPATKGITLSSTTLSIAPGATTQLTATLTGVTGNVTWTSNNADVITVTPSEDTLIATLTVVEGVNLGTTAEITATCGEYSAKCTVTVEETSNVDELAKYILGADGEGRDFFGIINPDTMVFLQDPLDSTSTVHEKVKLAYMKEEEEGTFYIRYNRDVYKFDFSVNIINGDDDDDDNDVYEYKTVKDSLALVNAPTGNLGKYVTYANNTWIVLKDDANGVELISANGLGELTFEALNFNAGRTNYNKAVETIVNKCKTETGLTSNIRSVGSTLTEEEALSATNTVDFSALETFTPTVDDSQFAQYEGATNGLRKGDTNYESDYAQMEALGILSADNLSDYWLASRFADEYSYGVYFRVRYVYGGGDLGSNYLCNVNHDAYANCDNTDARAVRPVVSLESGILDGKTETGLRENPIVLD